MSQTMAKGGQEPMPGGLGVQYKAIPRFPDFVAGSDGSVWASKNGQWVRLRLTRQYHGQHVHLAVNVGHGFQSHYRHVAPLILSAFVGPCPDGHEARHKSGDRGDNRLENLFWAPRKRHP
jgi:hypothetical protein